MKHAADLSGVCSDLIEQGLVKMSRAKSMRQVKMVEKRSKNAKKQQRKEKHKSKKKDIW